MTPFEAVGFAYTVLSVAVFTAAWLILVGVCAWFGFANVWDWIKTGQRVRTEESEIQKQSAAEGPITTKGEPWLK